MTSHNGFFIVKHISNANCLIKDLKNIELENLLFLSAKYRETGEIVLSNQCLRRILDQFPYHLESWFWLCQQEDLSSDINSVRKLENCLEKIDLYNPQNSSYIYYALAKVRETQARYDEAFDLYIKANNQRKCELNLFNTDAGIYIGQSRLHKSLFNSIKRFPNYVLGSTIGQDLIFIIGLPRCGSTLVEAILSMAENTCCLGESGNLSRVVDQSNILKLIENDDFDNYHFHRKAAFIDNAYLAEVGEALGPKIDKTLNNFYFAGLISRIWPAAKIIHVQRHPLDQILSAWKSRFLKGHSYTLELKDLVRVYISYKQLMDFWNKELGDRIYTCQYEELVNNPLKETKKLAQFCLLPWTESFLTPEDTKLLIKTASYNQVREPINNHSVKSWKKFSNHLEHYAQQLVESHVNL